MARVSRPTFFKNNLGRQFEAEAAGLVRDLRADEHPVPGWRLLHDVDVDALARQRRHVQRAVRKARAQDLRRALLHQHVVGSVVGRAVPGGEKHNFNYYSFGLNPSPT